LRVREIYGEYWVRFQATLVAAGKAFRVGACELGDGLNAAVHNITLRPAKFGDHRQIIGFFEVCDAGGVPVTELAYGAESRERRHTPADDCLRLVKRIVVVVPERPWTALTVRCLKIVGDFPTVYVPDKGVAACRKTFAFQYVGV
jgi:hypothetical protein